MNNYIFKLFFPSTRANILCDELKGSKVIQKNLKCTENIFMVRVGLELVTFITAQVRKRRSTQLSHELAHHIN